MPWIRGPSGSWYGTSGSPGSSRHTTTSSAMSIAACLKSRGGLAVRSVGLDDPHQGLSAATLDPCEVLIWWGHARHGEISPETGKKIVARITSGRLSLIVLHSAHWSTPFVQAMEDRTRNDARRLFPRSRGEQVQFQFMPPAEPYAAPAKDAPLTPSCYPRKYPGGITSVRVELPNCCFPGNRADGKPGFLNTVRPDHPIAEGIPKEFTIPDRDVRRTLPRARSGRGDLRGALAHGRVVP